MVNTELLRTTNPINMQTLKNSRQILTHSIDMLMSKFTAAPGMH